MAVSAAVRAEEQEADVCAFIFGGLLTGSTSCPWRALHACLVACTWSLCHPMPQLLQASPALLPGHFPILLCLGCPGSLPGTVPASSSFQGRWGNLS